MPKLTEPKEGLSIVNFLADHFGHHISSMDVNGTDSHDPLSVSLGQISQEQVDERVQLVHLLLVVVLDGCLISFLEPGECDVHFRGPPYLSACKSHLYRLKRESSNYHEVG